MALLTVTIAEQANIPDPAEVQERYQAQMPSGVTLEGVSISGRAVTFHLSADLTAQQRTQAETFFTQQAWATPTAYRSAKEAVKRDALYAEISGIDNTLEIRAYLRKLTNAVLSLMG